MAAKPQVKIVTTDGVVYNPTPKDDLEMIFNAYNAMLERDFEIKIDKEKCRNLAASVTSNTKKSRLKVPEVQFGPDGILAQKSWEEILIFYETKYDRLLESENFDLEEAARLERWFICFVEPPPQEAKAFERWYNRELEKTVSFMSTHAPYNFPKEHLFGLTRRVIELLPPDWGCNYKRIIDSIKENKTLLVIVDSEETIPVQGSQAVLNKSANINVVNLELAKKGRFK